MTPGQRLEGGGERGPDGGHPGRGDDQCKGPGAKHAGSGRWPYVLLPEVTCPRAQDPAGQGAQVCISQMRRLQLLEGCFDLPQVTPGMISRSVAQALGAVRRRNKQCEEGDECRAEGLRAGPAAQPPPHPRTHAGSPGHCRCRNSPFRKYRGIWS